MLVLPTGPVLVRITNNSTGGRVTYGRPSSMTSHSIKAEQLLGPVAVCITLIGLC
jgi:hypothetical protein